MKIKPRGKIYSLNEGYAAQFDKPLTKYLDSLKNPTVSNSKDYFNSAPLYTLHNYLCLYLYGLQSQNPFRLNCQFVKVITFLCNLM